VDYSEMYPYFGLEVKAHTMEQGLLGADPKQVESEAANIYSLQTLFALQAGRGFSLSLR
jgi:hypothetical protein